MNKENILKVADAIERHSIPDLGFNMNHVLARSSEFALDMTGSGCGTVACIAGWSHAIRTGDHQSFILPGWRQYEPEATWLGLTRHDANDLFVPSVPFLEDALPAKAVAVLRHLAETGVVDWSVSPAAEA